jgi:CheY-like chemotaxis protein
MSARILVVDDDRDNADSLSRLIAALGRDAVTAYSGAEAIAVAHDVCPELAFIDLAMPGMDGFETARRLRLLLGSQTILVALTGWSRQEDRHRSAHSGFDLHYAKPLDIAALEQLLAIPIGTSESTVGV